MKARLRWMLLIGVLTALAAGPARALRCGSDVVKIGYHKHKVLNVCGEPTYFEEYDEPLLVPSDQGSYYLTQRVEIWTYDFGPQRFVHALKFINGVLVNIDEQGYGYRE